MPNIGKTVSVNIEKQYQTIIPHISIIILRQHFFNYIVRIFKNNIVQYLNPILNYVFVFEKI